MTSLINVQQIENTNSMIVFMLRKKLID